MEIEQQKINSLGHILKANVLSKEEKITVYQLMSRKNQRTIMSPLINGEQILDNQTDIKQHIEQHYQQFFNGNTSNTDNQYTTIEDIVQELEKYQIDDQEKKPWTR
jgi:hypothetical protein